MNNESENNKKEKPDSPKVRRQKLFLTTFEAKGGHISMSCKAAGIHRSTYYEWCKDEKSDRNHQSGDENVTFCQRIDEIAEGLTDNAEVMLQKKIAEGDGLQYFSI